MIMTHDTGTDHYKNSLNGTHRITLYVLEQCEKIITSLEILPIVENSK